MTTTETNKRLVEVLRYQLRSQNILSAEQTELYELAQLAGVIVDPQVFKIVLELLQLGVTASAVLQMLKSMCGHGRHKPGAHK